MSKAEDNSTNPANHGKGFKQIPNPYNPYDIESGMLFYRKDVIEKIKTLFHAGSTQKLIVIQGYSGSGKTSTLRKMADDPTILGDDCIPIYLKPDKDVILELERFLLFIHQSIKSALENHGINVDGMNISNITLHGLQQVLNRIGFKPGDNRIIVLIFDDFEKIQKSFMNNKNLINIISLLRYLLAAEHKFRLIIAGAGQIFDWATGTDLKSFLNTDASIELKLLDKKLFESLIVDPVKHYVNYTPSAIDEIKSITGMNLYCQQLLCFYIVNFLNETEKNLCTNNEVRQAIINTINDQREDFSHFWNSMSSENQIAAAALTYETIVNKKGAYYFLEESPILSNILHKETFKQTLKKLANDQYVNRLDGKRFLGTPYKVPLFGEWVKKHHPFPETIVDNWQNVINRVSLAKLSEILESIPVDLLPIDAQTAQNAISLSKAWNSLNNSFKKHRIDRISQAEILDIFCEKLDFKVIGKPENNSPFHLIDAGSVNLHGFDEIRTFFFSSEEPDDKEVNNIQEVIQQHFSQSSFFSFLFCIRNTDRINELIRKEYLGIILITEENMKNLVLSPRAVQVFKEDVIIPQVKPSRISTYQTHGPATITFYGRHDELSRILGSEKKNFAIIGARKIGKTSLLKQIAEKLPVNTLAIYMDLESPKNQDYTIFLQSLQDKLNYKKSELDARDDIANLKKFVMDFCGKTGKYIIFLLDEMDILLKYDNEHDYQLIKTFRALYQEGYCQFILSGFEEFSQAAENIDSPLYNYCEFIQLSKLKEADAEALVLEPMEAIGVKFDKPDDLDLILKYTSCHPNLLQFFCKNLIESIEQHKNKNRRIIFKEDIMNFYESIEYESYVLYDFYLFITESVKPIERLIVLLLLEDYPAKEIFSIVDIDMKMRQCGINLETGQLTKFLRILRLRYIFEAVKGGRYRFALPAFPLLLKKREDLDIFIKKEIEHARQSL